MITLSLLKGMNNCICIKFTHTHTHTHTHTQTQTDIDRQTDRQTAHRTPDDLHKMT